MWLPGWRGLHSSRVKFSHYNTYLPAVSSFQRFSHLNLTFSYRDCHHTLSLFQSFILLCKYFDSIVFSLLVNFCQCSYIIHKSHIVQYIIYFYFLAWTIHLIPLLLYWFWIWNIAKNPPFFGNDDGSNLTWYSPADDWFVLFLLHFLQCNNSAHKSTILWSMLIESNAWENMFASKRNMSQCLHQNVTCPK